MIQILTDYNGRGINRILKRGTLLCGVITSGLHLAGTLLQRLSTTDVEVSSIYCRTEHRTHGAKKDIEGRYLPCQPVIIIDDVCTSGRSIMKVVAKLRSNGLVVRDAMVIAERVPNHEIASNWSPMVEPTVGLSEEVSGRVFLSMHDVKLHSLLTVDKNGITETPPRA